MKKLIFSLVAVATVFMFSGCAGSSAKVSNVSGMQYKAVTDGDGIIHIKEKSDINKVDRKIYSSYAVPLKRALRIAAIETKNRGFNYFVITNKEVNNLNGFPINRYKDLNQFITLQSRKGTYATDGRNRNDGLIVNSRVKMNIKPVGNEYLNSFISVWSVEQTLRDTK